MKNRILSLLRSASPAGYTRAEVAAHLGITSNTARSYLLSLEKRGLVVETETRRKRWSARRGWRPVGLREWRTV